MKLLGFLLRQSPWLLAAAVATGIAGGLASAVLLALVNVRLTHLAAASNTLGEVFASVIAVVLVAHLASHLLLLRLSTAAVFKLRMHLCRGLLGCSLREVEAHGPAAVMAVLTEDLLAVSDTLANFPLLCINLAVLLAGFGYLFWLDWRLALLFVATFVAGVFVYGLIERRTRPYLREGRATWDVLIGFYQALIHGNKELKLHRGRREAFFAEGVEPAALRMRTLSLRWHSIFALAASYGQVLYFLVIGVTLFVAPRFGHQSLPVLAGFTLMTIYMSGPINYVVGVLPAFERATVSVGKIEALGLSLGNAAASDLLSAEGAEGEPFSEVEMVGLRYTYHREDEDREFALGPLDVRIQAGELVFIVGGNGSGKSSFARLVTGLYAPDSGTILLNGRPVTDSNRDRYRQNFSVIFSDNFLFDRLFGLLSAGFGERAAGYLDRLRLASKVRIESDRFSTTALSQGQRKRLALLAAFAEDRPVYLFDEWAADQDPTFKKVFYEEILLDLKRQGKTVLVISHDEHYYHLADRTLKFENGLIVEDRLHHERAAYAAARTA